MSEETNKKEKPEKIKRFTSRTIFLILYFLIMIYIIYLIIQFGFNPLVVAILVIFVFLTTIGPFFRQRNRRSLYSRMFPDRKRKQPQQRTRKKRRLIIEKKPIQIQPKIFKPIDLEFEYRKPLISNCENCGNILPNFVKNKCPFCGEQI